MSVQPHKAALTLIAERRNDPIVAAFQVIFEYKLEKAKDSLLVGEDPDQRGKGKMCQELLKILNPKVTVDNQQ